MERITSRSCAISGFKFGASLYTGTITEILGEGLSCINISKTPSARRVDLNLTFFGRMYMKLFEK